MYLIDLIDLIPKKYPNHNVQRIYWFVLLSFLSLEIGAYLDQLGQLDQLEIHELKNRPGDLPDIFRNATVFIPNMVYSEGYADWPVGSAPTILAPNQSTPIHPFPYPLFQRLLNLSRPLPGRHCRASSALTSSFSRGS